MILYLGVFRRALIVCIGLAIPAAQPTLRAQEVAKPTVVYQSKIDERVDIGAWTKARTVLSPDGTQRFMGAYGGQGHNFLNLPKLPGRQACFR